MEVELCTQCLSMIAIECGQRIKKRCPSVEVNYYHRCVEFSIELEDGTISSCGVDINDSDDLTTIMQASWLAIARLEQRNYEQEMKKGAN